MTNNLLEARIKSYKKNLAEARKQPIYVPDESNLEMRGWFREAKFGIFIHWGIYSLLADGEWVMFNRNMSVADYEKLLPKFYPIKFNAREWVTLFKEAGCRYITITTKHHDGFCMFNSKLTDYNIVKATPFKRDVIKELADECRRQGLKIFFYYSLSDWHWPEIWPTGKGWEPWFRKVNPTLWEKYRTYMVGQIRELCTNYGEIGGIWFDGNDQKPLADWRYREIYDIIHELQPQALIGNNHHFKTALPGEDFRISEGKIGEGDSLPMESCFSIHCGAWGYKRDAPILSLREIIHLLVKCVGHNSNFLLSIGPMPTGEIPPDVQERLREIGDWLRKYGESIYGTRGGPFAPADWGVTTHKDDKVYVHVLNWNSKNCIVIPAITDRIIKNAWILGGPTGGYLIKLYTEPWAARVEQCDWGTQIVVSEEIRPNDIDTIVGLQVEGKVRDMETYPNITVPLVVNPAAVTLLRGDRAELRGGLRYHGPNDYIEGWNSLDGTVSWKVKVLEAGDYEVAVTYSCASGNGGSEYEIVSGNSRVIGKVRETTGWAGGWYNFEKELVGVLHLPKGFSKIKVRVTKKPKAGEAMRLHSLELIPVSAKDAIAAERERARRMRASTEWFVEAKYGVMFHWTAQTQPRYGPQKPYWEAVRDFDVNAFADMVMETGAGYVIFTACHAQQYFPAPIQTLEKILPGRTCQRDLIGEIADALNERGVKLILYYHQGLGDTPWLKASGFYNKDKTQFYNNVCSLLTEVGERYGKKVAGYWFDDRNPLQPFERLYKAAKAGNPDRIIAWNSWIYPKLTEFQEYYAGEFGGALVPIPERSYFEEGGPQAGLQPHGLIFLDDPWVHGKPNSPIAPPRFETQELIRYVKECIAKKFVITMNLGIYQDGTVSSETLEQMKALRKSVRGK